MPAKRQPKERGSVNRSNMPTRETEDLSKDGFHKKRLPSLAPKRRPPARQSITYRSAVSLAGPQLPSAGQADRRKLFRSFFITAYTQQPSAKPKTRYLLPPFFPSMSSAAPDGCILRNRSQRLPTCLAAKIHSVIFRNMTRLLIFVLCAGLRVAISMRRQMSGSHRRDTCKCRSGRA